MESVIQISMPAAATLIVGFFAVVLVFGRLLLGQVERRMTAELGTMRSQLKTESINIAALAAEVHKINSTLPLEYVRREDWIRFSASIDAKLDRLAELVHRLGVRQ
jgi:hypothetical protein